MKETDLTQGKIFQKLIKFSLPMIAGNLLQQIYNLVDTHCRKMPWGRCFGSRRFCLHTYDFYNVNNYRTLYGKWCFFL